MVTRAALVLRTGCAAMLLCAWNPAAVAEAAEVVDFQVEGRSFEADLFGPSVAPRGTVVLAHGFLRDRQSLGALARELADRGALVLVPDLPFLADPVANAAALSTIVIDVRGGRFGPVPARTILIGFSAGGLASLLAAARTPGITGWIGLDPVDRAGEGLHAAARVSAPAIVLRAAPHSCNAWANSHGWGSFLPRLQRDALMESATHCDFENPGDPVCSAVCGAPDPQRQAAIRAEVAAAVDLWLQ
jgi:pimeloyl-ACP methyl ester carboxylesterase